jgi:hypothetical protein
MFAMNPHLHQLTELARMDQMRIDALRRPRFRLRRIRPRR